jgi:hypothetical protein
VRYTQLSAAGFTNQHLLPLLQVAETLAAVKIADWDASSRSQLFHQLQELGLALNTLLIDCACSNPYCSNMSGTQQCSSRAN